MSKCIVCGQETNKPIEAALEHFRFYEAGNWQYLKGNMSAFGKWHGFWSTIGLAFPFFCTIRNWKYRKYVLVIDGITDNQGRIKNSVCLSDIENKS